MLRPSSARSVSLLRTVLQTVVTTKKRITFYMFDSSTSTSVTPATAMARQPRVPSRTLSAFHSLWTQFAWLPSPREAWRRRYAGVMWPCWPATYGSACHDCRNRLCRQPF